MKKTVKNHVAALIVVVGMLPSIPGVAIAKHPLNVVRLAAADTVNEKDGFDACKGKTAADALKASEGTKYATVFKDSKDHDITEAIASSTKGDELLTKTVIGVEVSDGFLFFFGPTVTFTLDYVDQAQVEKEEAEKALRNADRLNGLQIVDYCKKAGYDDARFYWWTTDSRDEITGIVSDKRYERSLGLMSLYKSSRHKYVLLGPGYEPPSISVEDDPALREFLDGGTNDREKLKEFAEAYAGHIIHFDGCVSGVNSLKKVFHFAVGNYFDGIPSQFVAKGGAIDPARVWNGPSKSSIYKMDMPITARVIGFDEETGKVEVDALVMGPGGYIGPFDYRSPYMN